MRRGWVRSCAPALPCLHHLSGELPPRLLRPLWAALPRGHTGLAPGPLNSAYFLPMLNNSVARRLLAAASPRTPGRLGPHSHVQTNSTKWGTEAAATAEWLQEETEEGGA